MKTEPPTKYFTAICAASTVLKVDLQSNNVYNNQSLVILASKIFSYFLTNSLYFAQNLFTRIIGLFNVYDKFYMLPNHRLTPLG
jgi:hypothetical protein